MANTDLASSRPSSPGQERAPKPQLMAGIYPGGGSANCGGGNTGGAPNPSSRPSHSQATMALEQYRLQLYNYALNIERLRCPQYASAAGSMAPWVHPYGAHGAGGNRMATLSTISLFPQSQRIFQPEEPKPQHSYIGLIAMAILSSTDLKLVLSDIYQYILDNYPYFRTRGPGWRNSIRHNLSLNDCFIKSGRSANGKGHYWAIHPANMDDFRKGDFRRRKAQRKVRKHMGLSVDDASTDSPSPPPLDLTTPPPTAQASMQLAALNYPYHHHYIGQFFGRSVAVASSLQPQYAAVQRDQVHHQPSEQQLPQRLEPAIQQSQHQHIAYINSTTTTTIANLYSQTRKRQFDVASLLAPDVQIVDIVEDKAAELTLSDAPAATRTTTQTQHTVITKVQVQKQQTIHREVVVDLEESPGADADVDGDVDIDVVDDVDEDVDAEEQEPEEQPLQRQHPRREHHLSTQQVIQQVFTAADDNISYLSDARRSSFDADNEEQEPHHHHHHHFSPSATYARSLGGSSSSQHDSNSLEECPIGAHVGAQLTNSSTPPPLAMAMPMAIPKTHVELNHMDPHILSRYYGTYMAAAAARRANLEATRAKSITPPPPIELVSHQSSSH
ncbi:uncharacterized protein LOC115627977 [Scaptodrosophila lebanonensis]|uniref:Uncharacterized protein LOC115627977 n=1 Tax=Drosophila lebanonensis TaxID=7225 RepID=A0A6J2TX47_DROLE|nr:uncharacterized protein LOC115627977 [Scaptodrosophila lebanonensis]